MKILIINHNGGSVYHGPNLRTYYAAKEMSKYGHKVTIASSSYSHKYSILPTISGDVTAEEIDGVSFRWVKCIHYKNIFQRIYSHFQFGLKLVKNLDEICRDADVVVFSGPPPEIFFFAFWVSRKLNVPILSDVRDLWPLTQVEMSKLNLFNPFTYFLYFSQYIMVKKSSCLITPLPGASKYFSRIDSSAETFVIENGFDVTRKIPENSTQLKIVGGAISIQKKNEDHISSHSLSECGKFIVGYSGAFDRDNDTDSFINAAALLQGRDDILFLMVGGGIRSNEFSKRADELPNLVVCDRVASSDVPSVLSVMDVCYCGLKPKKNL